VALLEIRNLRTYYRVRKGQVKAVDGVDFTRIAADGRPGRESGCGKTTLAFGILQISPRTRASSRARSRRRRTRLPSTPDARTEVPARPRRIRAGRAGHAGDARSRDAGGQGLDAAHELMPILQQEASLIETLNDHCERSGRPRDSETRPCSTWPTGASALEPGASPAVDSNGPNESNADDAMVSGLDDLPRAMNAFNPVYRVGDQIEEALEAHMEMTANNASSNPGSSSSWSA